MVEKIKFLSEDYEIEGLLNKKDGNKGVVITHPHPLYGGDMYNMVVETMLHVFNIKGYSTLKFNFRGVGKSQGRYDNGVGEQKDVLAAFSFLEDLGIQKIDLAGYSFGAWVNAQAATSGDIRVENMAMVSPPVRFMDFREISAMNVLKCVITGSRDDIAPADAIKKILPTWNPDARFEIIPGADHFYGGYLGELESVLSSCI
jgi:uncharacterized protein